MSCHVQGCIAISLVPGIRVAISNIFRVRSLMEKLWNLLQIQSSCSIYQSIIEASGCIFLSCHFYLSSNISYSWYMLINKCNNKSIFYCIPIICTTLQNHSPIFDFFFVFLLVLSSCLVNSLLMTSSAVSTSSTNCGSILGFFLKNLWRMLVVASVTPD